MYHVRYNFNKQCWEGSSDGGAFFDITENHFVPSKQGNWLDFLPYADDFPAQSHSVVYPPELDGDVVVGCNFFGRPQFRRTFTSSVLPENTTPGFLSGISMQPSKKVDAPPVSNPGEARIYFDRGSNKLKISENGGAYANLV